MTEKNENAAAVRKRIEEAFADARYRGVKEKDLFHSDVVEGNPEVFGSAWK